MYIFSILVDSTFLFLKQVQVNDSYLAIFWAYSYLNEPEVVVAFPETSSVSFFLADVSLK